MRVAMSIASITAGFIIDRFNKGYTGFVIVFTASFILSVSDIILLGNIKENISSTLRTGRISMQKFLIPIKMKQFRDFLLFSSAVYLFYTISTSFTPVYLVKYLGASYKMISSANVLTIISTILTGLIWRRVEIKFGLDYVMRSIGWIIAAELFTLFFIGENTTFLFYAASVLSGAGAGSFVIFSMSMRYSLMTENDKTIFEGWYFFCFGLAMLIAPVIGGVMLPFLEGIAAVTATGINKFQFLYIMSCSALLAISAFRLITARKTPAANHITHTAV